MAFVIPFLGCAIYKLLRGRAKSKTGEYLGLAVASYLAINAAALCAALAPQPDEEAEDAYFFVTDRKGNYYYARTYADHQKNCDAAAKVNKSLT
jgi:hypothetical protein